MKLFAAILLLCVLGTSNAQFFRALANLFTESASGDEKVRRLLAVKSPKSPRASRCVTPGSRRPEV